MITFLRHAQSLSNKYGTDTINPSLSTEGKLQAKTLTGHYDLVIISPLKRTMQTFNLSQIKANVVQYSSLVREHIASNTSRLQNEGNLIETNEEFNYRINQLRLFLLNESRYYKNILVVTHHGVILALTGLSVNNGTFVKTTLKYK